MKYCNAACKKKHRHKHKKECDEHQRLAAERASQLHDEQLFKQPPPLHEDCPICFQRMPLPTSGSKYKTCCGKLICSGCIHAVRMNENKDICAFCRTPPPKSNEETINRLKKLMDKGNAYACNGLGFHYASEQGICHKIIIRHWNYGIRPENLVVPEHIVILAILIISVAEEWKLIKRGLYITGS